jgi:hypothetical protein
VKLTASDAAAGAQFGAAVAFDVNRIIVGAPLHDASKADMGTAYAFLRVDGAWVEQSKTTHKKAEEADEFGHAVAVVTAHRKNLRAAGGPCCDFGVDGGAAYMYDATKDLSIPLSVEPAFLTTTTLGQVKQSALLQNFPNPFNPETWLPYRLAVDAPVSLRIYNVEGQLIRKLPLGMKKAGSYMTRETATYWDGRDRFGETVASGVYFYALKAGSFQATRRMLIVK